MMELQKQKNKNLRYKQGLIDEEKFETLVPKACENLKSLRDS